MFFIVLQCYVFNKRQPLPLEVEHLIVDTIGSLRPNLTLYATHSEAVEAAIELERKFRTRLGESDLSHEILLRHMTLLLLSGDSGTEQDGGEESDEEEGVSEHGGSVEDEEREDEQDEVGGASNINTNDQLAMLKCRVSPSCTNVFSL